jgi:hypothetical protein
VNKVFLETAASLYAELTLLLELAMAVGLVIGALLARQRRFRPHAWCQSVIVLLNLAVIFAHHDSFVSGSCVSEDTAETW